MPNSHKNARKLRRGELARLSDVANGRNGNEKTRLLPVVPGVPPRGPIDEGAMVADLERLIGLARRASSG